VRVRDGDTNLHGACNISSFATPPDGTRTYDVAERHRLGDRFCRDRLLGCRWRGTRSDLAFRACERSPGIEHPVD